jgi:uncharacterized Fe-S cluster-containing radical SAM superfamily protein
VSDITQRIDAVTKIGEDRIKAGGIQPAPKSVKIEITGRCNLRCKFCAVRTREHQPSVDMSFFLFQKITEDMRLSGVEEIGLFYLGESFMAPELLKKCTSWLKADLEFPYVFLTSNAVRATADVVEEVMQLGIDSLKWSVNCHSAEQFSDITGGSRGQYFAVFKNIKDAWTLRNDGGYKTMLSASSILYDPPQQKLMDAVLDEHVRPFVDKHYWLPLYQMSMYSKAIENLLGYVPTAGNMGRIAEDTMLPNRKPLPCWSAFTEGHVRVDGGLSACCFGADDRFDMGVLDGTNFMRQWNSQKFQDLRIAQLKTEIDGPTALKHTPCRVCVAY